MKTNMLRWVLVPLGSVGVFFAVLFFNLFVLLLGPHPKDLAVPTAGVLMGVAMVLVGSLIAPKHQAITAFTLSLLLCCLPCCF